MTTDVTAIVGITVNQRCIKKAKCSSGISSIGSYNTEALEKHLMDLDEEEPEQELSPKIFN